MSDTKDIELKEVKKEEEHAPTLKPVKTVDGEKEISAVPVGSDKVVNGLNWKNPAEFAFKVEQLQDLVDPKSLPLYEEMGATAGILNGLHTDGLKGLLASQLTPEEVAKRHAKYGVNKLPPKKLRGLLGLMWDALHDKTLIMLMGAACISLAIGIYQNPTKGWIEGTAIVAAVLLVVMVTSINDYSKEKQFQKLNNKKTERAINVIRDGVKQQVNIYDLVVGDVLIIETGDILPGDAVLIEGHDVKTDESTATGESVAIKKEFDSDPFFLSSTKVIEGYGRAVVIAVGPNSYSGKIMMALQRTPEDTPLQVKLGDITEIIGKFGLIAAILIMCVLTVKYFIILGINKEDFDIADTANAVVGYLITAITVMVVAVPEGLPLAVTLTLAYSMMKMLKDNNLVRRLEACETMGEATTICSDKTGTLTMNIMTVVAGFMCNQAFGLDGHGTLEMVAQQIKDQNESFKFLLGTGIACNTKAYRGKNERGVVTFLGGNQTESALLDMACQDKSYDFEKIREDHEVLKLYGFTSARKRMSTIVKPKTPYPSTLPTAIGAEFPYIMYTKGASEIVLGRCTRMVSNDGTVIPLADNKRKEFEKTITKMASCALRTICMAYKEMKDVPEKGDDAENELILLGLVGIKDPVRPEVPNAVRQCQKAGIMVRMVTGDNLITAINIAKQCNIYKDETSGIAMEGPVFRRLSEDERDRIIPRLQVLSRSSPLDKELLVSRLKAMGEIVAVTGDGTNDAPALQMAHVGFSMGITGTEVAKEASAVILMDDNFASIVKAAMWGRNVFDSIRKFLQFQLTVNVVAVTTAFVGAVAHPDGESPLRPVQLLWVNLIMDTLAALALATEKPTMELLDRPPTNPKESLLSPMMRRFIVGHSVFQLAVLFTLLFVGYEWLDLEMYDDVHLCIFFNTFVWMQIFNELNAHRLDNKLNVFHNIGQSPLFLYITAATIVMQYLIVEYGGDWTHTAPLTGAQWGVCVAIGFLQIPYGLIIRLIPYSEPEVSIPMPAITEEEMRRKELARSRFVDVASRVRQQVRVVQAFRRPVIRTSSFYQQQIDGY